jgi:aromatic-L-amino-acid decarboxylase
MSIKTYGLDTFKKAVTYNIDLAEETEEMLRKSKNWEVISPATLAVINYRYNPIGMHLSEPELDKLNQEISARVTKSKEALLVTTILQNQVVLRMCLINPSTTFDHIKETFSQCHEFAKEILAEWKVA